MTTTTPSSSRKIPAFKAAFTVLAALAATLTVQAAPAAADESICGHQVGGDILTKYISLGRSGGVLGCPLTDELTNPDGVGRRQQFERGSIYWKASTGAHPVWGAIRDKWGTLNWEAGALGYPVDDELTNLDGVGKGQQFEGGTMSWHPDYGAHHVWGQIARLWNRYGKFASRFGYPVTDERRDDSLNGYRQTFSVRNTDLFWSSGMGPGNEVCTGECAGYVLSAGALWVETVSVKYALPDGDADHIEVSVTPTQTGYEQASTDYDSLWQQVWNVVPTPLPLDGTQLSQTQLASMKDQLTCHAKWDFKLFGKHLAGDTWDLESWRPQKGEDYATSVLALLNTCNWN
ncbi:DUF2599 domain-containing protein [Streptomyces sp. NPDC059970]|uniref:DUF2599 domain-containing protein n=1 Tax=Streptomyces sp. NPDC059970 TaxID=3347019 RepID=UPI0036783052